MKTVNHNFLAILKECRPRKITQFNGTVHFSRIQFRTGMDQTYTGSKRKWPRYRNLEEQLARSRIMVSKRPERKRPEIKRLPTRNMSHCFYCQYRDVNSK